jgi:agmatine deiminase
LQYSISREAYQILSNNIDAKGRKLNIHKIPIPPPMYYTEEDITTLDPCDFGDNNPKVERIIGERLAGSYVNFYIANKAIILPSFSPLTDKISFDIVQKLFPDYEIIQIPGRDILLGGGNIHCITQQVPSIE